MKTSAKVGLITALIVALIVGYGAYRLSILTTVYTYRTEYGTLPENDAALTDWLKSQPGVSKVSVVREGNAVAVRFERSALNRSPAPNPQSEDERLGYKDRGNSSNKFTTDW